MDWEIKHSFLMNNDDIKVGRVEKVAAWPEQSGA